MTMDGKVSLARVVVSAPEDAPPLVQWLEAEAARWVSSTFHQSVSVQISDVPRRDPGRGV